MSSADSEPPSGQDWPETTDDDAPDAPPKGERTRGPREYPEDEPPGPVTLTRIGIGEIMAPLPPIRWLVQGLDLCPGAVNLIAGFGFSGKTVAAQAMALDVATGGRVWEAFTAGRGRVLHVDYEQGRRLTLDRYQRLAAARLLTPDDIGDRLAVVTLPDVYLDSLGAEEILTRECEGHALLLVDSLRAAAPTIEENDSGVRHVLDLLSRVSERTGVVPIVLHHARKPSQDKAGGAKMAIRGSGAIFDACASVLVFEASKGMPTRVSHEKARTTGKTAEDFTLRIEDVEIDGNARGGLSVTAEAQSEHGGTSEEDDNASRGEHDAKILELVGANPGSNVRALRGLARPMRNTEIDDAVGRLAAAGKIETRAGARGAVLHFPRVEK